MPLPKRPWNLRRKNMVLLNHLWHWVGICKIWFASSLEISLSYRMMYFDFPNCKRQNEWNQSQNLFSNQYYKSLPNDSYSRPGNPKNHQCAGNCSTFPTRAVLEKFIIILFSSTTTELKSISSGIMSRSPHIAAQIIDFQCKNFGRDTEWGKFTL